MYPGRRLFSWGFVFLFTIALLLDCGSGVSANPHGESNAEIVHLDQEFILRVGNQVEFESESLKIRFLSVASDSRCPKDVMCVWGGNAEVLLEMSEKKDIAIVKLDTHKGFQSSKEEKYLGYRVKLIDLSPYPQRGKKIEPTDYAVTLIVSKD